jgi:hypothetical protein
MIRNDYGFVGNWKEAVMAFLITTPTVAWRNLGKPCKTCQDSWYPD